jgi:hypothetical protein
VSPSCTTYQGAQSRGGPQGTGVGLWVGAGDGLGDWVDAGVGDGVTLGRASVAAVGAGAVGDGVWEGAGVSVGEGAGEGAAGSVGEAESTAATVGEGAISTTVVGLGRTLEESSWLNRKLPSTMPILMSVRAKLLKTRPVSETWPAVSVGSGGGACGFGGRAVSEAWAGAGPNNWWALSPSRGCFTGLPRLTL